MTKRKVFWDYYFAEDLIQKVEEKRLVASLDNQKEEKKK